MRNTKKLTMVAMMIALSVVFHTVEGMVWNPAEFVVPGFKLGLANIVGLIALFKFDSKTMITVNFMRVMISSLLTGYDSRPCILAFIKRRGIVDSDGDSAA